MKKLDLRKELGHLYNPSAREVAVVDVPAMSFLMVDGQGNPSTSEDYAHALETLYTVSYALKFIIKRGARAVDYAVMPLEGLWWVDDMSRFSLDDKDAWCWTALIMQPEYVTEELVERAKSQVEKKKGPLPGVPTMRFETLREGLAAQIMHIGPYSEEGPTVGRLHKFIEEQGHRLREKHHEIYLKDPRRTAPDRLKTVIRQPFERA